MTDHSQNNANEDSIGALSQVEIDLSTWCDIDSTLSLEVPETPFIEAESLGGLLNVYECLDLLNRVWPKDSEDDTEPEEIAPSQISEIGPYSLLKKIGQGGMGTVWEARQEEPIQRRLAIKLISAPLSASVNRRFEAERNVLAIMNHPNIARIVDAGTTDDGHLYFAMELVQGSDINAFCHQQDLDLRGRLNAFLDVCAAVQHAHQNGVIHRDLKPSNVMVDTSNDTAVVKVIDFGLAKVLDQDKADFDNDATRAGQILGSLWYMSPEQAGSKPVDTRTDVYSLGVILYQLLTGVVPLNKDKLKSTGLSSILNAIQNKDPQRPSQRLLSDTKSNHSQSDRNLISDLKGDLDWIAMRALEKDRERRYSTVQEFAADIRRFLNNEPVEARPRSTWYSLQTFTKRHRAGVIVGSILVTALAFCAVFAGWSYFKVSKANKIAATRLSQTRQSNEVLAGIFSDLNFDSVEAVSTPLRMRLGKRLVTAAEQLKSTAIGDPLGVAKTQLKLGQSLNSLGLHKEAGPVCQDAYAVVDEELGMDDPLTRDAGRELVLAYVSSTEFAKAKELLFPIMDYCESELGSEHAETLTTRQLVGQFHVSCGDYSQALVEYKTAADGRARLLGDNALPTVESRMGLAFTYGWMDDGPKAVDLIENCITHLKQKLPAGHPRTLRALMQLAWAYGRTSERGKAVEIAQEAFDLSRKIYGPKHESTYNAQVQVGLTAYGLNQYDTALENLEAAVAGLESTMSRENRSAVVGSSLLAKLYRTTDRPHLALPIMETNLRIRKDKLPPDHTTVLTAINELADLHREVGDYQKAHVLLDEALAIAPTNGEDALAMKQTAAASYFEAGEYAEAIKRVRDIRMALEEANGRFDFDTLLAYADEAKFLSANKQGDEAIELLQPYLAELRNNAGHPPYYPAIITSQLGIVMAQSGRLDEGITLMESIVFSPIRLRKMHYVVSELRSAYARNGQHEKVADSLLNEVRISRRRLAPDSTTMGKRLSSLGAEAARFNQHKVALDLLNESVEILEEAAPGSWHLSMARMQQGQALLHTDSDENDFTAIVEQLEGDFQHLSNRPETPFPNEVRQLVAVVTGVAEEMKKQSLPEAAAWAARAKSIAQD
ncbi:MAG: tetratricopeptide repeat protein [Planctomycetaceae bacterium]